ncbi:hypothetical protein ACR9E3_03665 [Actinomycetospora sp. C-140]
MTTVQPPRHRAPAGAQGFGHEPHPSGPITVAPRRSRGGAEAADLATDAPTVPISRAALDAARAAAPAPMPMPAPGMPMPAPGMPMAAPMMPMAPAAQAAPAPKRRRRWPWVVGALLLLLIIIASTSNGTATTTPTAAAPVAAPASSVASPSAAEPVPASSGPATSFGDGTHVVGQDIEPGTYRTGGPAAGGMGMCYWSRLRNTSGEFDAIIANGVPTGPSTVTIRSGDGAFETTGCGTWTKTN